MKHITGLYPRLQVDTARCSAVGQAGGVLLAETIRTSGLGRVGCRRRWRRGASRSRSTTRPRSCSIWRSPLALGGDCLADVALLRAEPGVFGRVASDPTVSRTDRRAGRRR